MPTIDIDELIAEVKGTLAMNPQERQAMLSAGPPEADGAPGFSQTYGRETSEGIKAMSRMGDITNPANMGANLGGLLGATRVVGALPTAAGAGAGKAVLEATDSPVAAGVADAVVSGGLGAASGLASRGINRGMRAAVPYIVPGASQGILEGSVQDARGLAGKYAPPVPSSQLYAEAAQTNPIVADLPRFRKVAEDIVASEGKMEDFGKADSALAAQAQSILNRTSTSPGLPPIGVEIQDAEELLKRLGQDIDQLRDPLHQATNKGGKIAAAKKQYKALIEDLENAGPEGSPVHQQFRLAATAAKREFAQKELGQIVESGIKSGGQGAQVSEAINYGTILNNFKKEVQKNELFVDGLGKKNLEEIEQFFQDMKRIPAMPPPKGANAGSMRMVGNVGVGTAIGGAMGGPFGAAMGGATAAGLTKVITAAATTGVGRRFFTSIVKNHPSMLFSPQGQALIIAAARAGAANDEP